MAEPSGPTGLTGPARPPPGGSSNQNTTSSSTTVPRSPKSTTTGPGPGGTGGPGIGLSPGPNTRAATRRNHGSRPGLGSPGPSTKYTVKSRTTPSDLYFTTSCVQYVTKSAKISR